ncbi:MAG: hypothetical protein ABW221_27030 [Vicinamibacteria bacterium]
MTRANIVTVVGAFVVACGSTTAWSQAVETKDTPAVAMPAASGGPVEIYQALGGPLYDNGPFVTHPGVCSAAADASRLQDNLGLTIFGFGAAVSSGFRVADDFVVPAPGWVANQLIVYTYQTGSTPGSPTITDVRIQIWNGPPNAGGTIVFGDTTTNRFVSAAFSNAYRDLGTQTCPAAQTRPIMAVTASIGTTLAPGTYWVDYQIGGTLASGPWVVPTTILGETDGCAGPALCNAIQWNGTAWAQLLDTTINQDAKFAIEGVLTPVELQSFEIK